MDIVANPRARERERMSGMAQETGVHMCFTWRGKRHVCCSISRSVYGKSAKNEKRNEREKRRVRKRGESAARCFSILQPCLLVCPCCCCCSLSALRIRRVCHLTFFCCCILCKWSQILFYEQHYVYLPCPHTCPPPLRLPLHVYPSAHTSIKSLGLTSYVGLLWLGLVLLHYLFYVSCCFQLSA